MNTTFASKIRQSWGGGSFNRVRTIVGSTLISLSCPIFICLFFYSSFSFFISVSLPLSLSFSFSLSLPLPVSLSFLFLSLSLALSPSLFALSLPLSLSLSLSFSFSFLVRSLLSVSLSSNQCKDASKRHSHQVVNPLMPVPTVPSPPLFRTRSGTFQTRFRQSS